jgi:IstB-like ATP binding protein
MGQGTNIVLFDPDHVEIENIAYFRVKRAAYFSAPFAWSNGAGRHLYQAPASAAAASNLHDFEILEERSGRRSTIITSQVPVDKWHELIGDLTLRRRHPRSHRPQRARPHRTSA